jgi:hypothetical protein
MSTKTSIKRIAAVAAVALTLGGFSAVTAFAAEGALLVTAATATNAGSNSSTTETATATAGVNNYVGIKVNASLATPVAVVITGGTGVSANPYVTGSGTAALTVSAASIATDAAINIPTPTAGTITVKTYTISNGSQSSTASAALTITVSNPAVYSAGLSTAVSIKASSTVEATAGTSDTLSAVKTAGTIGGEVRVTINDGSAAAYNGATVSATVAGAGLVSIDTSSTQVAGTVRAASLALTAGNVGYVHIAADGTSGTGTITISVTDLAGVTSVLATKTVTFTGSAASVKSVGNLKVLKASSVANYTGAGTATDALTVATTIALTGFVFDSNGNKATGTVKAISSDATVLGTGTCVAATGIDALSNEYNCPVYGVVGAASGKSATVTFAAADSLGAYTILATPVTFTIGGAITKEVLSLDSTSYASLTPIKITVTATDASGNAAYDQDSTGLVATPVSSIQLGGKALTDTTSGLSAAAALVGGVATYSGFYAPAVDGTFTVSGTDTLAALNAVSASATVTTASSTAAQAAVDAANEATDAANAATDAANNAMDSADAAQQAALDAGDKADAALAAVTDLATKVSAIATQIAALSALVKKIAAKVKA